MTKKVLAVELSKLKVFENPSRNLEQYPTDSEVAADALWMANLNGWIFGNVLDLGAGTGILGIGCILLGAKDVEFLDNDAKALKTLNENLDALNDEFEIDAKITVTNSEFTSPSKKHYDLIVMNPPFGTQEKNIDTEFLKAALRNSNKVITFHKAITKKYIDGLIKTEGFKIKGYYEYDFPLKSTMPDHKKHIERIKVGCWHLEKKVLLQT